MLEQKYHKSLIQASTLKAKKIPLEVLRQPKTTKNEETIPFNTTYNPNNANVFHLISFKNFQNFQKKRLVNSMSHEPLLGRSLCKPKLESK